MMTHMACLDMKLDRCSHIIYFIVLVSSILQQPRLRGLASTDSSEDQPLEVFDTSKDFDSIDGYDEDYPLYESEDEDEDEYEEFSFAASTFRPVRPLVKQCFRWHNNAFCRRGGSAGHCSREYWTEKCIYCKRGEEADSKTGKCVSSGGNDNKVKQCFRWHDSAACRGGGRAGHCRSEYWTEKCIYCTRGEEADRMTGKCVSSGGNDNKLEQCFRWHDDAFCRKGSRAGHCRSEYWTEKCIYCKRGEEADRMTGKCVSSGGDDEKVRRCFSWHDDVVCRRGFRPMRCARGWTDKCIMCSRDKKVNEVTGTCERNEMVMKEA